MNMTDQERADRFPRVTQSCARAIMTGIKSKGNPELLASIGFKGVEDVKRRGWAPSVVEELEDLLDATLARVDDELVKAVTRRMERTPVMDRRMEEAIRRQGISPVALFAIAKLSGSADVALDNSIGIRTGRVMQLRPDPDEEATTLRQQCWIERIELDLAPGIMLIAGQNMIVQTAERRPDTITAALNGRPIEDVLRHPATDGLDLRVTGTFSSPNGTRIIVGGLDIAPLMGSSPVRK